MIGKQVLKSLDSATDGEEINVSTGRSSFRAKVRTKDSMSCSLDNIGIKPNQAEALDKEQLDQWADRVKGKVGYLLESLDSIEHDQNQGVLVMRSNPPETSGTTTSYYELELSSTPDLDLQRRQYDRGDKSVDQIPINLTNESLEKLANDLEETLPE